MVIGLAGLSGFGIIVAEILKKWRFIDAGRSNAWVVVPILLLFLGNESLRSTYIGILEKRSPRTHRTWSITIKILLLIGSILVLIGIPFLWYGLIKELAMTAR